MTLQHLCAARDRLRGLRHALSDEYVFGDNVPAYEAMIALLDTVDEAIAATEQAYRQERGLTLESNERH